MSPACAAPRAPLKRGATLKEAVLRNAALAQLPILPPSPEVDPKIARTVRLHASCWDALDEVAATTGHYRETVMENLLSWALRELSVQDRLRAQVKAVKVARAAKAAKAAKAAMEARAASRSPRKAPERLSARGAGRGARAK